MKEGEAVEYQKPRNSRKGHEQLQVQVLWVEQREVEARVGREKKVEVVGRGEGSLQDLEPEKLNL